MPAELYLKVREIYGKPGKIERKIFYRTFTYPSEAHLLETVGNVYEEFEKSDCVE